METTVHKSGPRDVFLYLLVIITLYICVWRFIDLLFGYVNVLFPDPLNNYMYYGGSYYDLRLSIASLIVVFPLYLGLTWYLRKDIIKNPEKRELRIRKWLLNFTLFVAALTIIIDLITLLNNFLDGDITVKFILKVLIVLLVAGSVFAYYLWDLRRDTMPGLKPSKTLAIIASAVVLISIVSGFFIIGSPFTQRLRRFDDRRVNDLQAIQNEVNSYYYRTKKLPANLDELTKSGVSYLPSLVDPENPELKYEYKVGAALKYEICATFSLPSDEQNMMGRPYAPYPVSAGDMTWDHPKGRHCFARTVDPNLYNGISKPF